MGKPATAAYELAGYKPHARNSWQLRKQPHIQQRYGELISAAAANTEVTAARLINELAAVAFGNAAHFLNTDERGRPHVDIRSLTAEQMASLDVTAEENDASSGDTTRHWRRVTFKFAASDKVRALVELCKIFGLYRERVEVSGPHGGPIETTELSDGEAARRIAFILRRAGMTTIEHEDKPT